MNNELIRALTREIHAQANGPSAWNSLTEAGREYYYARTTHALKDAEFAVSQAQRPMKPVPAAPWPVGADNAKIVGWNYFFKGGPRDSAPFPINRGDLWRDFKRGWDVAAEQQAYG
jgi:hypothetical protein